MAPTTRSTSRQTPPPTNSRPGDYDTVKKLRFFNAYDARGPTDSLRSIAREYAPSLSTAHRWLKERNQLGSPAHRRTRKLSVRLGRRPAVSKEQCETLVSPSKNPVRDQLYEAQIEYHNLHVHPRTLQRRLRQTTNNAQRYKQAYIEKVISKKNRGLRVQYGQEHQDKTIDGFWQFVFFSDEAHIDPSSTAQGYILREQGTRYDTENIQERGEKTGVELHVAAWVTWDSKAEKLEFYNDENEHVQRPPRPKKPRRSKWESDEEFAGRIQEWEALLPHEQEVKPKGNAMTQKYYTDRLLPVYIDAVQKARLEDA